jgi:hypothetical protein
LAKLADISTKDQSDPKLGPERERWPDTIQPLSRNVVQHIDGKAVFVFELPSYTGNRDCGARSDELEGLGFKIGAIIRRTERKGGLYEGIIANLPDSRCVR